MRRGVFCLVQITAVIFGLLLFNQSINAQCVPPPGGMAAWWPLDEASGPIADDIAGSVNNSGTWINNPVPVAGKVAGALSFDGSNSVDVPDDPEVNFGVGDFSIDLWIKTADASGTRTILDKRTMSGSYPTGFVLFMSNGYLGSQIGDGAGYNNWISTGFVADGNWHHIAVTVDRDNPSGWLHYLDGSVVGPIAGATAFQGSLTNTAPFVMARNLLTPSQTFVGTLDEVELFYRVLNPAEISSIWDADSYGKCKNTCYGTGDANYDGLCLTAPDLIYLATFINACGPAPIPLYSCDLNGDGYVDPADLQLYNDYFVYGISVFDPYGGYPVLCPCDPIPAPVPDTVNIFGLEHVSAGPTCLEVNSEGLIITRFTAAMAPDGIIVDIPDAISSPPLSIIWRGEPKEDPSLGTGATIQVDCAGIVNDLPDQYIGSSKQIKKADGAWELSVKEGASAYTVEAYLAGAVVWSNSGIAASGEWFNTGNFSSASRAPNTGPHGHSVSNIDDAGIVAVGWGDQHDTVAWNWAEQSVSGLAVDYLSIIPEGLDSTVTGLSSIGVNAQQMNSLTITSETISFSYGDVMVTNRGNAIVTPVETTLAVSNVTTVDDGFDAEQDAKDGDWSIVWENPDQSGTFPTGASVGTEFFFATPAHPDSIGMALSMTKAAANTWNLAVQSGASLYTIEAFNNGSSVFSIIDTDPHELGYIVETARGIHPVGFSGATSGKPASVVASSDYDFTASPGGVEWSWAAHGVSGLTIDYLSISTEIPGTSLFGVTHATMSGANGSARSDPISFTILDIEVVPFYICGDVTGDELVNILDIVYLINYKYKAGPAPDPMEAADVNHDTKVDILDIVYLINYKYKSGPEPNCL